MTGSSTLTTVTFRLSPDLKARVDKLANKTGLSSSYFYDQLVADHIDELEDIYDCLAIIENVKKGCIWRLKRDRCALTSGQLGGDWRTAKIEM